MKTYIITYDLNRPGQNYDSLIEAIKSYRLWAKIQKSTWAIKTTSSAIEVRDALCRHIDSNDSLFVGEIGRDAAWFGLLKEVSDWLKRELTS
ncbi:hypothetical protein DW219_00115 [Desulfovibrio sp. AM18-2]|nr:hypothetical protein DW219_00115 [Desulfovibrio sp. AM18-2]